MSDHFYALAAPGPSQSELDALDERVLDWLVAEDIVERELTDCILSMDSHGHRPAPRFMTASSEPETPTSGNCCYALFSEMKVNGLEIVKGRHIIVYGEGSYECSICPACGAEGPVWGDRWNAAADEWLNWRGPGNFQCMECSAVRSLPEWDHRDPIGFGALTFKFWNWPPLSDEFRAEMARRLGYPVQLITGSY